VAQSATARTQPGEAYKPLTPISGLARGLAEESLRDPNMANIAPGVKTGERIISSLLAFHDSSST
jgi:hypothetical protein